MGRLKITQERRRVEAVSYRRQFDYEGHKGWGFSFDCDAQGNIKEPEYEAGRESLAGCLAGSVDGRRVVDRGIQQYTHRYTIPAEGLCVCGATVVLDGDTHGEGIDCDCGRIYNAVGQELAPRSQWDERPDYNPVSDEGY